MDIQTRKLSKSNDNNQRQGQAPENELEKTNV